jgi:hypothetical protein
MLTPDEIKQLLPSITKTIGGYDIRNLELMPVKNNNLLIIGEVKAANVGDEYWSTKDAIWHIKDGFYASWVGGSENLDIQLLNEQDYLDKKEEYLKTLTHTKGGYPVRNLHLVKDGYFNDGVTYIRGDYYREEIKDWVVNEIWWLDGEHLIEPTDYHLSMK